MGFKVNGDVMDFEFTVVGNEVKISLHLNVPEDTPVPYETQGRLLVESLIEQLEKVRQYPATKPDLEVDGAFEWPPEA